MEAEVNNGGFHQYLSNLGGETAEFSLIALRRIGARSCAEIVERALRRLSSDPIPTDQAERQKLLEAVDEESFEEIDAEFYPYPDDLTHLLFAFIQAHLADFGL